MPDAEAQAALKEESAAALVTMTAGNGATHTLPLGTLVSAGLPEQLLLTLQQSASGQDDDGMGGMQQMTTVGIPGLGSLGSLGSLGQLTNVVNGLTHHHQHQHAMASQMSAVSMPQFILAGGQLIQGIQGAQLLIPTSSGVATQHILTIPINQVPSGQMVQMVTTNGQIVTTSLANLQALTSPQPQQNTGMVTGNLQGLTSPGQMSSVPQIITNAHGQVVAISPHQPMVTTSSQVAAGQVPMFTQTAQLVQDKQGVTVTRAVVASKPQVTYQCQEADAGKSQAQMIQVAQTVSSTSSTDEIPTKAQYAGTNATISQTDANTVDGINLEEIKEFAKAFKIRRLSLGLTQTQVGQALSITEGPAYSQSAICRFEKLDITPKSAQKIKPVLERWMKEAEERYRNGAQNLTDFMGSEPSKKRKRRTSFTPQALEILNLHFERNTHPSGAEMTELAEKLNYDREVVRVWFCNKRQALKNTIKKLKTP